jgi:AraC-like DNA-binding protein
MPFTLDFYCHQALLVSIPRILLASRVSEARLFTARCITAKSKLASMTGAVMREIAGYEEAPVADISNRLVGLALDVIATTLEAECAGQIDMQVASHRLLPQVEQYILSNLGDSTLDVDTIARAQNIAPRTLNRIFAAKGMTPIRWLWQQRLAASFKALLEGEVISVTDAAFRFGFTDLSHFSRAFKREFGQLPHEVQRALPSRGCRQR